MQVTTEKFSGPLGLLLRLIEQEEMDITEISLAKIADEYVAFIQAAADDIDPDQIADFLVIAAKLLFIKSRALLPYLYNTEESVEADELERQLRMYKDFIEAAAVIEKLLARKKFAFPKDFTKIGRRTRFLGGVKFTPPATLKKEQLADRFCQFLEGLIVKEAPIGEGSVTAIISIEERIFYIKDLISKQASISFSRLLKESQSRTEVIVNFLAVLELAKQRELFFKQSDLFGEIEIIAGSENI
jgi:segregation and condensation protein A